MLRVLAVRSTLAAALLAAMLYYCSFDAYERPSQIQSKTAEAAVVFTGQFDRIDEGLRLLAQGAIPRLFISGLNAGAGLDPSTFTEQFADRNSSFPRIPALIECCVQWGTNAENTIQNGLETACWLSSNKLNGPILLITSPTHMARANLALRSAGVKNPVIEYPTGQAEPQDYKARQLEFVKLIGLALALPFQVIRRIDGVGVFAAGCPRPDYSSR